ncbi:AAA family ATPase [Fictibacillus iocasae]|uniref:AAA family ATPase n=1 Tax=Fictibacillus iocasae TaxID=2715437 RepID=A0ABW2NQH0_9BACL
MTRIKHLYIYQFGGLKQWECRDLSSGLNVFYGENEAGKTTIMQFIAAVLFGFPHKQNGSSRYEPKDGGRRGGKIVFHDPEYGEMAIQRVDGAKAAGEVIVTLENGETHGEEYLREWLGNLDRTFFHGIFCFGLDGLQKLDRLSESELGDFLLGAGMTGGENLAALESRLEKKASQFFKPGGRKPIINSKIAELKEAEENLVKWKKKNESYSRLSSEKEQVSAEKDKLDQSIKEAEKEMMKLEKWKELSPVLQKWSENRRFINETASLTFPEDGVRRYESWRAQAVSLQGELHYLENKMDGILKEMDQVKPLSVTISREELARLNEQYQRITLWIEEAAATKASLHESSRKIRELEKEAGEEWTKDTVQSFSLSLAAKNSWHELFQGLQQLQQRKDLLNEQLARTQKRLEQAEADEQSLRQMLLPAKERAKRVEKRNSLFSDQPVSELADDYEYVKRKLDEKKRTGSSGFPWGAAALALGIVLFLIAAISDNRLFYPAAVALLAGVFLLLSSWRKNQALQMLIKEEERLRPYRKTASAIKREGWLEELERDDEHRQEWKIALRAVQEEEKKYHEIAHELDQAEVKELKLYREADTWRERHGWQASENMLFTAGILDVIAKLKNQHEEEDRMNAKLAKNEQEISRFEKHVAHYAAASELTGSDPGYWLKELTIRLDQKEKSEERLQEIKKQHASLADRAKEISSMLASVEEEISSLLKAADCTDENAFYTAAKRYEEYVSRKQSLHEAEWHLSSLGYSDDRLEEIAKFIIEDPEKLEEKRMSMASILPEMKKNRDRLAETSSQLDYERKALLEDGTYSAAVHTFEQLKSELHMLAKQWAVSRLANSALQKTREKYRTEKLPAVLTAASSLFTAAVKGRYEKVMLDQHGVLYVQDQQNTRFYPSELSKGTAELLYLCIRAALALHANSKEMLMIMDDITVNFDKRRTGQAAHLIENIAKQRQVLYFTCHEHVLSVFSNKNVYDMKAKTTV